MKKLFTPDSTPERQGSNKQRNHGSHSLKALGMMLIFLLAFAASTHAQSTYTEKLRKAEPGKGTVVVSQSQEIEHAVNGTPAASKKQEAADKGKAPATGNAGTKANAQKAPNDHKAATHTATHEKEHAESHKNTGTSANNRETKTHNYVSRARHKVKGYRICIFTGGNTRADKQKAIAAGQKCREKFSELAVYPSFEAPRWVTHVGDFKTREEAQKYVTKIRRAHISYEVRIVSCEVNVPY